MKNKLLLLLCCCLSLHFAYSQSINQNASWPNPNWTVTGSYNTDSSAFESDPTLTTNFAFDDDDAGNGSDDIIAAESPVIDLTPASNAGENWITITADHVYNYNNDDILQFEYWDADTSTWNIIGSPLNADTASAPTNNFCTGIAEPYTTDVLDISSFTSTQLTGFKYRIYFDDKVGGVGYEWGFCFESPTITSAAPPSCLDPTALTASSITDTSASLSWTENGTATTWDIEWGATGFTQGSGTMINNTTDNPYSLGGLSSVTNYDYYVRADCGGSNGESAWVGPFSFTTLPACGDTLPGLCYSQTSTIEVLASFEATSGNWAEIVINSGSVESCCDEILIYDGLNGTGNIIYGALTGGSPSDLTTIGNIVSTTGQISLAINSDGSVTCSNSASIDPISITVNCVTPPSCLAPSDLAAGSITASSASLSWTENNSATAWEVKYSDTAGFDPDVAGTLASASSITFPLNGLTANTSYEYYVRSNCGIADGDSAWAGPFEFRTACTAVSAFDENFDSVSTPNLPDCWTELVENGASSSGYVRTSTSADNSAPNGVQLYYSNSSVGDIILVSPLLSNLGDGTHRLIFDGDTNSSTQDVIVGTLSDPNDVSTFTPIQTFDLSFTYTTFELSFASYSGTDQYIGFKRVATSTFTSVYLDNIKWEPIPSCVVPTDLAAGSITSDSASLSWTENNGATAWEVVVQAPGTGEPTGAGTAVTSNPYIASSLDSNTAYEYYVRSSCGGGDLSAWAGPINFTTLCGAFSPEYTEDFTSYLPGCWSEAKGELDAPTIFTSTNSSNWTNDGFAQSGNSGAAKMNIYSTGRYEWLVSPSITLDGGQQLVFDLAYNDFGNSNPPETTGSDDVFAVIISTDNGATWSSANTLKRWDNAGSTDVLNDVSNTGETVIINLSSYTGNVKIGFYAESTVTNADNDLTIDNFIIQDIPSCPVPTALSASSITDTSASLSWTESGTATAWEVVVQAPGTGEPTGAGTVVTSNPYIASSLDSNTAYEYYVRSNCGGGDLSAWAGPFNFTTLIGCGDTVSGLCYSQTNTVEVLANFTATSGDWAEMVFNSGNTENTWDEILVYDGLNATGNLIFGSLTRTGGIYDTAGLDPVVSSTGIISLAINSDGSTTCSSNPSITPISVTFNCIPEPYVYDGTSWNTNPVGNITSSDDLIVMSGNVSLTAGISANNVTIMSGAVLELANGVMNVGGNLTNDGLISGTSRTIFNGSAAQTISGNGSMNRLEVNNTNGVTLVGDQDIFTDLRLIDGTLTTTGDLTLKSTSAGTAFIWEVNPTSGVSGNVTVERFIPAGNRAYRFLGAGTSGQSVFDAWQEGGNNSNGFGIQVTGTVGTVGTINATTGHDETVSGNASLFKWDNATQNWLPVSNTKSEILSTGTFYRTLVRGNRTTDLSINTDTPTDVTLRSTGSIATGNQMITGSNGAGTFLAIANPYQSKLNMSLATRTNLSNNMYYWDPTLNVQGAYTTIDITTAGAGTNGDATRVLEPGQGVFLQETAGASSIMFAESNKVAGFGPAFTDNADILSNPTASQFLRMKLYRTAELQSGGNSIDGLIMQFNSNENIGYDLNDAIKFTNLDENMGIMHSSGNLLAIEKRPAPSINETITLDISQYRSTDYSFVVSLETLLGLRAYIKDNLDGSLTEIAQGGAQTQVNFTIDPGNPASVDNSRFQIVFETVTLGIGEELESSISIYPNPVTNGQLNVQLNSEVSGDLSVAVFNSIGQRISDLQVTTVSNDSLKIKGLDQFARGVYFVKVTNNGKEFTSKFIID